jgi:hypothetical protein
MVELTLLAPSWSHVKTVEGIAFAVILEKFYA